MPYRRLNLRELSWQAAEKGFTLFETLQSASRCKLSASANSNGAILSGTSAHGHTVAYTVPKPSEGGATLWDFPEMYEDYFQRYDAAIKALAAQDPPISPPTDAQIVEEMLALMIGADEVYQDYREMRWVC